MSKVPHSIKLVIPGSGFGSLMSVQLMNFNFRLSEEVSLSSLITNNNERVELDLNRDTKD